MTRTRYVCATAAVISALTLGQASPGAQRPGDPGTPLPSARLEPADPLQWPAPVDSNSPAVWMSVDGQPVLHLFASDVSPRRLTGSALGGLGDPELVRFVARGRGGHWIEGVLPDVDGTLYGFYHHEPDNAGCGDGTRTRPLIGVAVSGDRGRSWTDLGPLLRATGLACDTANRYFAGGVGDFSVLLGPDQYVYVFFTSYDLVQERQGVALARFPWADRDLAQRDVEIWSDGAWRLVRGAWSGRVPLQPTPLWPVEGSWHEGEAMSAFWGPSVHWNVYLQRYVMLLNRAGDHLWNQEGVYIAYAESLTQPSTWSEPVRLLEGGRWYPQVVGSAVGLGTDRLAGRRARFFMGGQSDHVIVFTRP